MQAHNEEDSIGDVFAALADPTRRQFLQMLASGEAPISELASTVPISLPAVSRHLTVLQAAGLIAREKRGRVTWCRLQPEPLTDARDWLDRTRTDWNARLDRLAALVEDRE